MNNNRKISSAWYIAIAVAVIVFLSIVIGFPYNRFVGLSYVAIPFLIALVIIGNIRLIDSPINKIDFTYILFSFFVVFVLLFSDIPDLMRLIFIYGLVYTFVFRIQNDSLDDTFSLLKLFYSKNISTKKKSVIAGLIFLSLVMYIDSHSGSFGVSFIIYAAVMYTLIYYVTFYVEMMDVVSGNENSNYLLKDVKNYQIEIKSLGEKYTESVREQLKSERMKSELITNVSHDIRTPLTSIITYVDLLRDKKKFDDESKEYIDILTKKSWRLNTLINDLMDASKISSGNTQIEINKLDLIEIISQVETDYEEKFNDNSLEIISNYQEIPTHILADSNSTSRVLENIYGNISKYAMPNTRVYIDVYTQNDVTTLSFKNISKDKLNINASELVERFVRADESRNSEGSGLGLFIADNLMELVGGNLDVEINGDLFVINLNFKMCSEKVENFTHL